MPSLRPLVRHLPRPSLTVTTPSILSIRTFPSQHPRSSNRTASNSSSPLTCRLSSPASFTAQFSTSSTLRSDDAHGSHYDPPSGWLFGVPPDEKYKKEGWENIWVYGFWGSLGLAVVAYAYKPDSSIQTWALEEARRRLEAEGILPDPSPPSLSGTTK